MSKAFIVILGVIGIGAAVTLLGMNQTKNTFQDYQAALETCGLKSGVGFTEEELRISQECACRNGDKISCDFIAISKKTEPNTPENNVPATVSNNLPSVHTVKVGDKIGNFTITSITIFPFIYPSDQSQDFTVEYIGETTVRGNYFWSQMLDRVCFMVSEEDALNIPRMKEDSKGANFCFSNTNFAKQALAPVLVAGPKGDGVKHPATVIVRTYTEIVASKEGSDLTELITATQ